MQSFNSKMVRLEVPCSQTRLDERVFQFQNGTIRRRKTKRTLTLCIGFNSKMVRLEEIRLILPMWVFRGFNSKMVRLEGGRSSSNRGSRRWFQFQNGTIRSHQRASQPIDRLWFQFQNGTIRRSICTCKCSWNLCFNSKMVRLEVNTLKTRLSLLV